MILLLLIMLGCSTATVEKSSKENAIQPIFTDINYVAEINKDVKIHSLLEEFKAELVEDFFIGGRRFVSLKGKAPSKRGESFGGRQSLNNKGKISLPKGVHSLEEDVSIALWPRLKVDNPRQSAYLDTNLENIWTSYQGENIRVAVIDTGINTQHEDFQQTNFENGWDLIRSRAYKPGDNYDSNGHGTHVAGIIAASLNGKGISGVAPKSTLIPYRVFDSYGRSSHSIIANAIVRAVDKQADIINLSLGGYLYSSILATAVEYAQEKGVIVVAAAGNDGVQMKNYPASLPGVVAVAASNGFGGISYFSSRGNFVDISAPGTSILSLDARKKDAYVRLSGTSMAAPFISGVFALMKNKFPSASSTQLEKMLFENSFDAGVNGYDEDFGWGIVRPENALSASLPKLDISSKLQLEITRSGQKINSTAIINIYDAQKKFLYALQTSQGKASIFLAPATYYYSSSFFGYSSGLQQIELKNSVQTVSYDFKVKVFTLSTYSANGGRNVDSILKVYHSWFDPYNILAENDDRAFELYSSVTLAVAESSKEILVAVESYGSGTGDYLLYIEESENYKSNNNLSLWDYPLLKSDKPKQAYPIFPNHYYRGQIDSPTKTNYYKLKIN